MNGFDILENWLIWLDSHDGRLQRVLLNKEHEKESDCVALIPNPPGRSIFTVAHLREIVEFRRKIMAGHPPIPPSHSTHPHVVTASFPGSKWDGSPHGGNLEAQLVAEMQAVQDRLVNGAAWQALTPGNGWTQTASQSVFGFRQEGMRIHLRGQITPGTITDGTTLATLPAGSRPAHQVALRVAGGGTSPTLAATKILIGTDGTIKIYGIDGTVTSLDVTSSFQMDN